MTARRNLPILPICSIMKHPYTGRRRAMKATIQGYASSKLEINAQGMTFWLPWAVFGKLWQDIATTVQEAIGNHQVIIFSQRVMTEREKRKDAPRWKRTPIDALSWFLFLLKIPSTHELVRLWLLLRLN